MRKTKLAYMFLALLAVMALGACRNDVQQHTIADQADSLMNEAYSRHDYDQLLQRADLLQTSGQLSEMKACYWRGYAYSRMHKVRLAENQWKKAVSLSIDTDEDLEYYSKSANRLAGLLFLKGDFEATMKEAVPAITKLVKVGQNHSSDFAFLQATVGCCQLRLGNHKEAAFSFEKSYQTYLDVLAFSGNKADYTSAIAGIITITDNHLSLKLFKEAYDWTGRFEELLNRYKQAASPDTSYLDKQQARLYLYKACALEGLGKNAEAAAAYSEAMKTAYSKTSDGKMEACNYLMSAKRWDEAAHNFEELDEVLRRYERMVTLDYIQEYLLPKFKANIGAHRIDSAMAIGLRLCSDLDSAVAYRLQDETAELATIYNTQQKETELAEQQARMERQRFVASVVALAFVILFFVFIIYFRHQSAIRLERAYCQLEVANERIKESSRMKTSFIQQISHEIRTPLNILSGFTQVITTPGMQLDDDTRKDINEKIVENTNRITELVNKMLELSDVSSKAVIERNDQVLALQVAAQAMSNFSLGEKYKIEIDLQVGNGADTAMMQTNEQAATRALVLLLDNAERFTKEGSIRLVVEKQGDSMSFAVEDTGIGVPPEAAEHIFEEFVQLNEYEEGTGIGLTVARSICRRLGGDVVLDTSYTGGARFVMTLPADVA